MPKGYQEATPAQKRIIKMENALCFVIRQCNGKPSRKLLDEIQKIAMLGVGIRPTDQ